MLVMMDASHGHRQFDVEQLDVLELANRTGQEPGKVRDQPEA